MTGRVDYCFCRVVAVLQFIRAGKLLELAACSTERASALPDLGHDARSLELHEETQRALQAPDMKERMSKSGAAPVVRIPSEIDGYLRMEIGANAALVKAAGIIVN